MMLQLLEITYLLALASTFSVASPSQVPRPVDLRFSRGNSSASSASMGYLEVKMSDGSWGPVCDLGFTLTATRLACALLGFGASSNVAKIADSSLTGLQAPSDQPVIGISDCTAFNADVPSTWNLAVACSYVVGSQIPLPRCRDPKYHVQISCFNGKGVTAVAAVTTASSSPLPPPSPQLRGRCKVKANRGNLLSVELAKNGEISIGGNGIRICAKLFGWTEAMAVCSELCSGSFIGLPKSLPPSLTSTKPLVRLTCQAVAVAQTSLTNCKLSPELSSAECPEGPAGVQCVPQGGPAEPPNPILRCTDREFQVAFSREDVDSQDRLSLGSGIHGGSCGDFTRGLNDTHVWLILPYVACNVSQGYNASHQIYGMQLLVLPQKSDSSWLTEPPLLTPLTCALPSRHSLGASPVFVEAPPQPDVFGEGAFRTDIALFSRVGPSPDGRSLEFYDPMTGGRGTPVRLGQRLFARVRLLGVANELAVRLRLLNCWATRDPTPDSKPRVDLLRDRCPVDAGRVQLLPMSDRVVALAFPAFGFTDSQSSAAALASSSSLGQLHVHCNLSVCNRSDSLCRGCDSDGLRRRRKRDVYSRNSFQRLAPFSISAALLAAASVLAFLR